MEQSSGVGCKVDKKRSMHFLLEWKNVIRKHAITDLSTPLDRPFKGLQNAYFNCENT